ncbi:MAG: rRNA maturation RNase YbeY [Desulfobacteraceae bacterium]|nr:MAG: rRNA maturation RNase YbeY [Desulfobacteraceae bacterium]
MVDTSRVHKKIEQILNALEYDGSEISVVIMDNAGIAALNRQYRDIEGPTNVLSFPMQEGDFADITPGLLGDVVLSAEYAQTEAQEAGITLDERVSQLLIHGILHLIGYDHEQGEDQAKIMEQKSLELIRTIENNTMLNAF